MLLTHHESTEDVLVRLLSHQEMEAKDLQILLKKETGKSITIQALYRSIKRLVRESVLIKRGTLFTVNREWSQTVVQNFSIKNNPLLSEGESASYSFKSLSALDAYWKHTTTQLHALLRDYPIFFYNRHVVWLHLHDRKESQISYLNSFDKKKRYAGFVVGGETLMDQEFKKEFNRIYLRVELRKIEGLKYDSVTAHGDYVITVKFNKKTTKAIDILYKKSINAQELENGLDHLFDQGGLSVKLTIENSKIKAKKLHDMLSKNFYIPKEIKSKFDIKQKTL